MFTSVIFVIKTIKQIWHTTQLTFDCLTYNRQLTVNQHDSLMSIVLKSFSELKLWRVFEFERRNGRNLRQSIVVIVQIGFKCFACTIRFTVNSTNDWKQKWIVITSNYSSRQFFGYFFWKVFSFVGSIVGLVRV